MAIHRYQDFLRFSFETRRRKRTARKQLYISMQSTTITPLSIPLIATETSDRFPLLRIELEFNLGFKTLKRVVWLILPVPVKANSSDWTPFERECVREREREIG